MLPIPTLRQVLSPLTCWVLGHDDHFIREAMGCGLHCHRCQRRWMVP